MKKFSVIFLILSLILLTAVIKNSTKRIDDEIFIIRENIVSFKKDYENIKLENEYLSSSEKLQNLQKLYFEDELFSKDIKDIKIFNSNLEKIENLTLINE
tara:strand:- start:79 stop:378 length:300 start_codon:yes stop_codon:yes gene_type:complete